MRFSELSPQQGNIVAKFSLATTQEVVAGCDWYTDAHKIAGRIASMYGLHHAVVAAVIAALSPNNKWERNLRDAENFIRLFTVGDPDDCLNLNVFTMMFNSLFDFWDSTSHAFP